MRDAQNTKAAGVLLSGVLACSQATAAELSFDDLLDLPLEELLNIEVSARKKQERLGDVPVSVSVIEGTEIHRLGAKDWDDISEFVPSVYNGRIRGLSTGGNNPGLDDSNSYFIDGVYLPRTNNNQLLLDMERVEVVAGPQGTLFGRNTLSGAVNYVTRKPEKATYSELGLEAGDRHHGYFSFVHNHELSDAWQTRLALSLERRDGYYHNKFDGKDLENTDRDYARWHLQFSPEQSNFKGLLSLDYYEKRRRELSAVYREPSNADSEAALQTWLGAFGYTVDDVYLSSYDVSQTPMPENKRRGFGSALTLQWGLTESLDFKSVTSWRKSDSFNPNDEDHLSDPLLYAPDNEKHDILGQEFLLTGAGEKLDWLLGLSLQQEKVNSDYGVVTSDAMSAAFFALNGAPVQAEGIEAFYRNDVETLSSSVFSNVDYHIDERWTATFGLRYHYDDKELHFVQEGGCFSEPGPYGPPPTQCFYPQLDVHNSFSDDGWSPSLALSYRVNSDTLLYSSLSRGIRSGGFGGNLLRDELPDSLKIFPGVNFSDTVYSNLDLKLDQEKTTNAEFGIKTFLPDQHLQINAALFHMRYEDFLIIELDNAAYNSNTGQAELTGLEWSMAWSPLSELTFTWRGNWVEAEYTDFEDGSGNDFSGNELDGVPDYTSSLQVDYVQSIDKAELHWHLDGIYRDSFYTNSDNTDDLFEVESRYKFGASLTYTQLGEPWEIYLQVRNLTNEKDEINNRVYSVGGFERTNLSEPRSAWLGCKIKF